MRLISGEILNQRKIADLVMAEGATAAFFSEQADLYLTAPGSFSR